LKKTNSFGRHRAVFGGAEAQHVNTASTTARRRTADEGERVREARAVHVQF